MQDPALIHRILDIRFSCLTDLYLRDNGIESIELLHHIFVPEIRKISFSTDRWLT